MERYTNKITFNDRDEYKRSDIANKIITLITSEIDTSPMIIDGGWGTGKSEFCYKLINLLNEEKKDYKVVYIDAFNEDHTDAPILTLLAAIATLLPQEERSSLIYKALPALRFGLKTTLKAGANWVLKQNTDQLAEDFQEAVKDSSNAAIDGTIEALLEDHIESEKNIKALKEALMEISKETPIAIFIDELDRCKPSFAISILENIKHVFDVENVHFILVTNTRQLEASIHHIYGHSVDAKRYLDKFVKFTLTLPEYFKPDDYNNELLSSHHWSITASKSKSLAIIERQESIFISSLIESKRLSLREVETLARYIEIYQKISSNPMTKETAQVYKFIYILGIFIYCFEKEIAIKMSLDSFDKETMLKALNVSRINYGTNGYPGYLHVLLHAMAQESGSEPSPTQEIKGRWNEYVNNLFNTTYYPDSIYQILVRVIDTLQMK
ncbi:KAP family P-loop NTPase fold protein [Serratia sp. 22264]|uniref:KAP family P-loop NTPase fold protein n=1 Tax=Serratia sp. 22264 TaxID=3453897 RepID=UPI003F824738